MPAKRSTPLDYDPVLVQRVITHQLLRGDHTERWSPKQLQRAISDMTPEVITDALTRLEANGVIWSLDEFVGASRCTRCLFALDLIGI
jgi:hypothetical protein